MEFVREEKNGVKYVIVESGEKVITDTESALDLLVNANYTAGTLDEAVEMLTR